MFSSRTKWTKSEQDVAVIPTNIVNIVYLQIHKHRGWKSLKCRKISYVMNRTLRMVLIRIQKRVAGQV